MKLGRTKDEALDHKEKCAVTIKGSIVKIGKDKAKELDMSFSEYVERALQKQLNEEPAPDLEAMTAMLAAKVEELPQWKEKIDEFYKIIKSQKAAMAVMNEKIDSVIECKKQKFLSKRKA
tara:strand:- start:62 stop:421 length:360 start_codon:yes stop_codon:yes gene_type:complete